MNNRTSFLLAGLIVGLWLPLAALAESAPDAARQADWTARLDKAAALIAEGKALKEAATKALEEKTPACDQKFLVNACRNEARKEYLKASHEAQRLESEGKAIEREVKKEQVADSKQRKAEEAPQQAAELEAREADTAAARQATQDKIEATQANKARQVIERIYLGRRGQSPRLRALVGYCGASFGSGPPRRYDLRYPLPQPF